MNMTIVSNHAVNHGFFVPGYERLFSYLAKACQEYKAELVGGMIGANGNIAGACQVYRMMKYESK